MPLLPAALEQITLADLQLLVDNEVQEGKSIEFKRELYRLDSATDKVKQHEELLKDVSSFANAEGGDLLIGVDAENGIAKSVCGFNCPNPDGLKLQINELVQTWVEPRLTCAIHSVKTEDNKWVLIIRLQRSLLAPHRVVYQRRFGDFWSRNSAGAYRMDTSELRRSFTLSETIFERIKEFRALRVQQIASGDIPVRMETGAKLMLHLIPAESFSARLSFPPSTLENAGEPLRTLGSTQGATSRFNMDGVVRADMADHRHESYGYVQLFRNGVLESVARDITHPRSETDTTRCFETNFELYLIRQLPTYLKYQQTLGIPPPVWLFITLIDIRGTVIHIDRNPFPKPPMSPETLYLPETEILDFAIDPFAILKPQFDMIWNAAGYRECLSFDTKQQWHRTSELTAY